MFALLCAALLGSPPNVTSGPELGEEALAVAAPIDEVVVFSDRATVRRRARVKLSGTVSLRFPDLPGATFLDTVRVESPSAKVLRVEVEPVERERVTLEEVDALLTKLERLADELGKLEATRAAIEEELAMLGELRPTLPPLDKRPPGASYPLAPETWRPTLELFDARRQANHTELRALERKHQALLEEHGQLQAELAERNLGGASQRRLQVVAIVQAEKGGEAELRLEYVVPGAQWKPLYELHFDPARSAVELRSAGLVVQSTGEDWRDVRLLASTAIPGQGIALPRLLTWTLGEKGEFVPRPRAERLPPVAALPPAAPPAARFAEVQRASRAEAVAARLAQIAALAGDLAPLAPAALGGVGSAAARGAELTRVAKKQSRARELRRLEGAPPPPPMAPPMAEPMPSAAPVVEEDYEAEPMTLRNAGAPTRNVSFSAASVAPEVRALALREAGGWAPPRFADPMLPAVLAGGFDYVYPAPAPATVPATGEALRVPLGARVYPVRLFYEATPSLATTAYLRAEVRHQDGQPLLAGKAAIFSAGDFLAEAELKTTGPGGTLELPLGADEDIRITYRVVPQSRTEGVFGKEDVTDYAVTIELGNYKKKDVRVRVWDQIPKTSRDKIQIELLGTTPTTAFGPDAKGLLGWEIDIPAGKTTKITMSYRIRRPADWRLRQH